MDNVGSVLCRRYLREGKNVCRARETESRKMTDNKQTRVKDEDRRELERKKRMNG